MFRRGDRTNKSGKKKPGAGIAPGNTFMGLVNSTNLSSLPDKFFVDCKSIHLNPYNIEAARQSGQVHFVCLEE